MNFLKSNIGYRYARFNDLFSGDMRTGRGIQFLKENIDYFVHQDGKLFGRYLTPEHSGSNFYDLCDFTELYLGVSSEMVMVPNEGYEKNALVQPTYLQKATADDLATNRKYFLYINKQLKGPFIQNAYKINDQMLFHLDKGEVFVLYKIDKC